MIRKALWLSATSAFLTLFTVGGHAEDSVVNVYNWSDYIDSSILDDFTKETGIKVVYDIYDSNEMLETKLLAGGSGYDVVVPSGNFLARQIQAGVFQKLDKSKLPNLANMWDPVSKRTGTYDPGNEYAVDYMWGTTASATTSRRSRQRSAPTPIDSWDVIFKPESLPPSSRIAASTCSTRRTTSFRRRSTISASTRTRTIAGRYRRRPRSALLKIRPYIQKFHSSEYINALANGDICLAVGYSGDIFQARNRAAEAKNGVDDRLFRPQGRRADVVRLDGDPGRRAAFAEAHEFINYMMRPEVIAKSRTTSSTPTATRLRSSSSTRTAGRPVDLSGCRDVSRSSITVNALRSQDPARRHAHLDQDRHRPISIRHGPGSHLPGPIHYSGARSENQDGVGT